MARPLDALPGDLGRKVNAMQKAAERDRKRIVTAAARAAAARQEKVIAQDTGGDMRLSGAGRRRGRAGNAKISVKVRTTLARADISVRGPLPLIDRDVPGHMIRSAYIRGAYRASRGLAGLAGPALPGQFRGDRRAVISIPGVGYRRSARHPGTRGKDTWLRGRRDAIPAAEQVIGTELEQTMSKAFRAGMR